jgi:tetratricopeptide (TPR) repeat protein
MKIRSKAKNDDVPAASFPFCNNRLEPGIGGDTRMLQHIFAVMNEALDDIIRQYPNADPALRQELDKEANVLKEMSDQFIEHWLKFEEKLARLHEFNHFDPAGPQSASSDLSDHPAETEADDHPVDHFPPFGMSHAMFPAAYPEMHPGKQSELFVRGQGYYKLQMFPDAVKEFNLLLEQYPDFVLARVYLAMGYLRMGESAEAYQHFQFLLPLTNDGKMKAISYNAMGCIQARRENMEKARELFRLAYLTDPSGLPGLPKARG